MTSWTDRAEDAWLILFLAGVAIGGCLGWWTKRNWIREGVIVRRVQGGWRAFYGAIGLGPSKATRAEAEAVAEKFREGT